MLRNLEPYRELIQWVILVVLCILIVAIMETIKSIYRKWKVRKMHTSTTEDGTKYHHNADFSGDVKIVLSPVLEVSVPFEVIKDIVVNAMRHQDIKALETMTTEELFNYYSMT